VPLEQPIDDAAHEIRDTLAPLRSGFSIALPSFGNPFAVGSIIRVSHNFLAKEIWLIGDAPHYEKASMGMEKYETIRRVADEAQFLAGIGSRPLYAIEKDHAKRSLYGAAEFPPDVVFLFGSERYGISDSLLARADAVLGIPIYGINHSLPVAVAAGIVMSEWARKQYCEGAIR
jgi:tRNA G18 (ribose-2'-O)-methylase SpoU